MNSFREKSDKNIIDVSMDEAKRLALLQTYINRKFTGKEKTLDNWAQLKDELTTRAAELGFVVDIQLNERNGNWFPTCDIVGRTDARLQTMLNKEGADVERKRKELSGESYSGLKAKGINPDLLVD